MKKIFLYWSSYSIYSNLQLDRTFLNDTCVCTESIYMEWIYLVGPSRADGKHCVYVLLTLWCDLEMFLSTKAVFKNNQSCIIYNLSRIKPSSHTILHSIRSCWKHFSSGHSWKDIMHNPWPSVAWNSFACVVMSDYSLSGIYTGIWRCVHTFLWKV